MNRRAYTLVEMMVTVAIIAILLAIAVPNFANASRRGKEETLRTRLRVTRAAVFAFYADTGAYPSTLNNLSDLSAPANGITSSGSTAIVSTDWRGPYLATVEVDPVSGAAFAYTTSGASTGQVKPSATGNDSNGVAFSTY